MFKILTALCMYCTILAGSEVLYVGTNAEFKPFSYIENDQIVGFDIDVARLVCERLGVEMKLKDMPFEALIPEVVLGQVHFVAAGMSYTQERAERVLFSPSYISGDPLVIVSLEKPLTLEELQSKSVVVNEGFVADAFLSAKPGITLVRLAALTDGFLAVKHKRADAFVTAKSTFVAFKASQPSDCFCITELPGTEQTCALVVSKKYPEIHARVEHVINQMIQDGTIKQLKNKWHIHD